MQDDQENMNTEENNLQTTTENNNNEPQYSIPQYSVPQYSVPQYSVPQYQEAPQNIIINNIQAYQQPTYPSNIPQPIVQQQNANLVQNQVQIQKEAGGGPNSWELFSFLSWILFFSLVNSCISSFFPAMIFSNSAIFLSVSCCSCRSII